MTITTIPAAPNRQDINNFSAQTDEMFSALPQYITQFNSVEQTLLSSASAAISSNTTAQNNLTAAQSLSTSATALYDNFDDRYLGYKIGSLPTVDNDNNTLLTGAMVGTNVGAKVWTGTEWLLVESEYSVSQSTSNLTSLNATKTQINNYLLNVTDEEYYFSLKYLGALAEAPVSPTTGVMYWNTSTDEMLIWSGSSWKKFIAPGLLAKSGGTMTGPLIVPSTRIDNLVVTGGFFNLQNQPFPSSSRGVVSQTQIRHKYLNLGSPSDTNIPLPFNLHPVIKLTPTANKTLYCNVSDIPPQGTRCTLILAQQDPNPGVSRVMSWGTNIRTTGGLDTFNGTGGPCMVITFISTGDLIIETARFGPV